MAAARCYQRSWRCSRGQKNVDPQHDPERRAPQDYSLQATQPVYNSGQTRAQLKQAQEQVLCRESRSAAATKSQVMLAAGSAYLDVLRDQQALALQQGNVQLLGSTLRAARQQLRAGAVTEADLAQAEARTRPTRWPRWLRRGRSSGCFGGDFCCTGRHGASASDDAQAVL